MGTSRTGSDQQDVLRFWWMLELFSPQKVPKPTHGAQRPADQRVVEWESPKPLPWEMLPPPPPLGNRKRVWQHTLYLGLYDLEATYQWLHRAFGEDREAYDERPSGRSACAGLLIDQTGSIVPESAVLSSALWAVARIENPGPRHPGWADGFPEAALAFTKAVDECESERHDSAGIDTALPHDADSLHTLLDIAREVSGIARVPDLTVRGFVIQSRAVVVNSSEPPTDIDFLNSFYLDDLAAVRRNIGGPGGVGDALAVYLTSDDRLNVRNRVDIVKQPQAVDAGVAIDRLPKGRWPSNPSHGLALSQQFAVNQALNDLAPTRGLMGVNGPPGTGKTTMLRDILAGNVVERARRLASLQRPGDAFTTTTHRWTGHGGHNRSVRQLRPELTGFEMVVASANNSAVENVTAEIPARTAIDQRWRDKADYFAEIASAVLANVTDDDGKTIPAQLAWGLVAARLGNKRNRGAFRSAFWFDKKDPRTKGATRDDGIRMQTRLQQWRKGDVPHKTWEQARRDFKQAEQRVDALVEQRRQAQQRMQRLPELVRAEEDLRSTIRRLGVILQNAEVELSRYTPMLGQAEALVTEATTRYDRHRDVKPGFLEVVFTLGRAIRAWRADLAPIAADLSAAEQARNEVARQAGQLRDRMMQLRADLTAANTHLAQVREELAELRAQCARDRERYAPGYPDETWTGDQRELHAPWLDAEIDAARSELFLAALQLHQDFLANAAGEMEHGLRAACDVVAGSYPRDLEAEKLRAAWQLFFLVVPLISTTFASVGRMFAGLGREAIGWLLIDEAGQASPQYAVGAIWRAQRVVAVGDPLQLEPVVTIPPKARRDIASAYGVSPVWIPPLASVQTLADRVSCFGTTLPQSEEEVWVSAPLRVHRRCDDPMFTLCNKIAYNDIMVNGVPPRKSSTGEPGPFDETPDGPVVAPSSWVDEPAPTPGTHLQANQIARLEKAIKYLEQKGVPASQVIAISPFRDVANKLESLTRRYRGLRAGTIHTAQGREAPVVFLVLGGDPDKPGAKDWASATVNLVNVAASRAQRRLFVIGDRKTWSEYNYFRQLSRELS